MNTILTDLIKAVSNIPKQYYETPDIYYKNGTLKKDSEELKNYERRFMIQFSIQYSKILDNDTNHIYTGSQTDFEIPKKYMYSSESDERIRDTFEKLNKKESKSNLNSEIMFKYFTTVPDFLIHKGQENNENEFQKLIIEAKTNPQPSKVEIFKDIFHINIYAEKYSYQNCVILLIHYPKKKWLADFRSYLANQYYLASIQKQKNIFIVFKESFESEPTTHSLIELKTVCQHNL